RDPLWFDAWFAPFSKTLPAGPRSVTRTEAIAFHAHALSPGTALSTRSSQSERASQQVEKREERSLRRWIEDGRLLVRPAVQELPAREPRAAQDVLQIGGGAIREVGSLLVQAPEGGYARARLVDVGLDARLLVGVARPDDRSLLRHHQALPRVERHAGCDAIAHQPGLVAALAAVTVDLRTPSLFRRPGRAAEHRGVGPMGELHEEHHQRLPELFGGQRIPTHTEVREPRRLGDPDREPRIVAAPQARDAKLVVRHRCQVRIERAGEVGSVVEEAEERLRRHADVRPAAMVDPPVDVAFEVARLAGEAAHGALRAIPRRHQRREEERLPDA